MNNTQKWAIGIVLAVVLVLIGWLIWRNNVNDSQNQGRLNQSNSAYDVNGSGNSNGSTSVITPNPDLTVNTNSLVNVNSGANSAPDKKTPVRTPESLEQGLTYNQAVNKYKDYRMQFNEDCIAVPSSFVLKTGSKFMFDNRSEETRSIVLDGRKHIFGPFTFAILTMSSKTLPDTVKIDCGNGRNNGQVIIER